MLRPIDSSLSLYNVDHKAHQAQNDPNAHQFQTMQQDEIVKRSMQQMNTVQKTPESEGEVRIRDKNQEKNRDDAKKEKKRKSEAEPEASADEKDTEEGHLNFFA
ncbi:MAG: hypothetical protein LBT23_00580 [Synergistaceae bacterium]|nr:hypothetical protein [Synergistaceae bacterium]